MNIEKRIKRHIIAKRHTFFVVTMPGFETGCARALKALSNTIDVQASVKGGITFSGRLVDLYRASLHLRTAGRILMRLATFKASNFNQLQKKTAALPWDLYLPVGTVPKCKVSAHHSRLYHGQAVVQRVARTIKAHWTARKTAPQGAKGQTLFVRLDRDMVTLSLDSSGANLYLRGFKTHTTQAPLRETLAAGILQMAGYRPGRALLDPMCGAGTFSLEAALIAKQIPPGARRSFAFEQWPAFRSRQWQHLKTTTAQKIMRLPRPLIRASDLDPHAGRELTDCVRQHGLDDAIKVECHDFFALQPHLRADPPGLIVLNPPYGRRLAAQQTLQAFYDRITTKLRNDFKGWQVALIVPKAGLARRLPFKTKAIPIDHGGLRLKLAVGRVN